MVDTHAKVRGTTCLSLDGVKIREQEIFKATCAEGETIRQTVNQWIRTSKTLDGVIDFDKAAQDPANPSRFLSKYDSGDHLHPSDQGFAAMGAAIDLKLFK